MIVPCSCTLYHGSFSPALFADSCSLSPPLVFSWLSPLALAPFGAGWAGDGSEKEASVSGGPASGAATELSAGTMAGSELVRVGVPVDGDTFSAGPLGCTASTPGGGPTFS